MRHPICLPILLFLPLAAAPAISQQPGEDNLLTCGYLCGEDGSPLMTAGETPPESELVTKIFIGAFSEACSWAIGGGPDLYAPEVFELTFRPSYAQPEEPDSQLRLYRYFCGAGAYNERHVYMIWTADFGVQPVSFAEPTYEYRYAGEDMDSAVTSIAMTGMTARQELVNSSFDEATRTVREWSCWRGLCDASGRGEWRLDGGAFRLVTYDIDPTYDGEVNLFRIADFTEQVAIELSAPLPFEPPVLESEEE